MTTIRRGGKLAPDAVRDISNAFTALLADMFALYLKTKSFSWHISGPLFRSYHLLLDEQGAEIIAATDVAARRVRKIGGATLRSVGHIARLQRVLDNDADDVSAPEIFSELREDNLQLVARLREAHQMCSDLGDFASAHVIAQWMDEAEGRAWYLLESAQSGNGE